MDEWHSFNEMLHDSICRNLGSSEWFTFMLDVELKIILQCVFFSFRKKPKKRGRRSSSCSSWPIPWWTKATPTRPRSRNGWKMSTQLTRTSAPGLILFDRLPILGNGKAQRTLQSWSYTRCSIVKKHVNTVCSNTFCKGFRRSVNDQWKTKIRNTVLVLDLSKPK